MGGKTAVTRCQTPGCPNTARGKYCSTCYRHLAAAKPKPKVEHKTATPCPGVQVYLYPLERIGGWTWIDGKLRRR